MSARWIRLPLVLAAAAAVALGGCLGGGDESAPRVRLGELVEGVGGERVTVRRAALDRGVEGGDERLVAPLIELLYAGQVGLAERDSHRAVIAALERLSGQALGGDWPAWVEWYGLSSLRPPPGFREWKGRLLGGIDAGFERFLDPRHPSRVRVEEVVWGGVLVDGIPALDRPRIMAARAARYLDADDPVFGVQLNGDARAYPLRILDWHEMVNDVVGGVPVSLAYCTLCGAGVLYETRTPERTYTFGSSGLLMRSNKLMYDRQTRTLWNQLSGEPVLGPLADERVEPARAPSSSRPGPAGAAATQTRACSTCARATTASTRTEPPTPTTSPRATRSSRRATRAAASSRRSACWPCASAVPPRPTRSIGCCRDA